MPAVAGQHGRRRARPGARTSSQRAPRRVASASMLEELLRAGTASTALIRHDPPRRCLDDRLHPFDAARSSNGRHAAEVLYRRRRTTLRRRDAARGRDDSEARRSSGCRAAAARPCSRCLKVPPKGQPTPGPAGAVRRSRGVPGRQLQPPARTSTRAPADMDVIGRAHRGTSSAAGPGERGGSGDPGASTPHLGVFHGIRESSPARVGSCRPRLPHRPSCRARARSARKVAALTRREPARTCSSADVDERGSTRDGWRRVRRRPFAPEDDAPRTSARLRAVRARRPLDA